MCGPERLKVCGFQLAPASLRASEVYQFSWHWLGSLQTPALSKLVIPALLRHGLQSQITGIPCARHHTPPTPPDSTMTRYKKGNRARGWLPQPRPPSPMQ